MSTCNNNDFCDYNFSFFKIAEMPDQQTVQSGSKTSGGLLANILCWGITKPATQTKQCTSKRLDTETHRHRLTETNS